MTRLLLVALPLAAFAGAVSVSADHARWSALLLHAEPFLLLAAAIGAYVLVGRRQRGAAAGLVLGVAVGFVLVRLPAHPHGSPAQGPAWARDLQGCAAAIDAPTAPVDLLQWTVSAETTPATVQRAVEIIRPDVLVLFDLADDLVLADLQARLGGEYQYHPGGEGAGAGFGVYTRGEFSLCDGQDAWSDGLEGPGGYRYVFVGLDAVTFPLAVARFPSPLAEGDWAEAMADSAGRLEALMDTVRSPLTVVVADAPVTPTYRHLFAELRDLGLFPVASPPNFPIRLGSLPLLPLHAYDRAWTGGAWTPLVSKRVAVGAGARAPVWTRLEPVARASARR